MVKFLPSLQFMLGQFQLDKKPLHVKWKSVKETVVYMVAIATEQFKCEKETQFIESDRYKVAVKDKIIVEQWLFATRNISSLQNNFCYSYSLYISVSRFFGFCSFSILVLHDLPKLHIMHDEMERDNEF